MQLSNNMFGFDVAECNPKDLLLLHLRLACIQAKLCYAKKMIFHCPNAGWRL